MKSTFRATTADDYAKLAELLAKSFDSKTSAPSFDRRLMGWKYWDRREDWPEPRSYVLERDGHFIAHAGLCPMVFESATGVHMIDWVSAKDAPGAGLAIVQKLAAKFDFIFAIGGSELTIKVLPALFAETAHAWTAARPLRPVRQILTHQEQNWKLPARLARNFAWSKSRAAKPLPGWKSVSISPDEIVYRERPPEFFSWLLRCPTAHFSLHGISKDGEPQGHFVITVIRGQARVAVWLRQPSPEHWRAAYSLAQGTALGLKDAFEIAARGTDGPSAAAAAKSGLHVVNRAPVYLLNKRTGFRFPPDFQFQFSEDDQAFLDTGVAQYYT